MAIHLRSGDEPEQRHRAGLIVHEVLTALRDAVRPGLTTMDLEKLAEEKIAGKPGKPAFKGYRGYPCSLCTSVNSEIVHGVPSAKRKLREGDIVSIDFGMEVDGYFADSAVTVPVGKIRPETRKLLEGMVIAVEPMVNAGRLEVRMRDEWVAETADGSPSAHFEHTVAVTANGPWILTRPKEMTGPSW